MLYRQMLRDAGQFPILPIRRKLLYNYREMFDLHRLETSPEAIEKLVQAGHAAMRVLAWLKSLSQARSTACKEAHHEHDICEVVSSCHVTKAAPLG